MRKVLGSILELCNSFLTERSMDMIELFKNRQGYEGKLAGGLERDGGVGAVHGKLSIMMDIYHEYESWIRWDIIGYNLDNIVGYVERYMEWISIVNNNGYCMVHI